jgi:hypothetical protein
LMFSGKVFEGIIFEDSRITRVCVGEVLWSNP